MGPNESKNFKTILLLQITAKGFQICPEFSSPWSSHKTTLVIFEVLLVQIAAEMYQTFDEFSSEWLPQNYVWDFLHFENRHFNDLFSVLLTWDPMGVKILKRYSYKS